MALYKIMHKEGPKAGTLEQLPFPETRQEAIAAGLNKYWPGTMCPKCKEAGGYPTIFVKSGQRICCVHRDAVAAYNDAVVGRGEPISPQEAMDRDFGYYWSPLAFPKCGHVGKTTLKGTCYECQHERENSPRQTAIRNGQIWYTPDSDDPCPKCGQVAPRRVSTGSCKHCEEMVRPPAPEPIYKTDPDAIIDYETAVAGGLTVYRTGKPCKYGHTGWRYVSTRGCLVCAGRE